MRVCYFGTYRANYPRNQILIEGLRQSGVEVIECHQALWRGTEDRVQAASGGWLRPAFVARAARAYWTLLKAYRNVGAYDVLLLGYPGQVDAYLARALTWLRRKPLVLDVFMSLHLIAVERGLAERHPLTARLIYWLEKIACRLPDRLILDTGAYAAWFERVYGVPAGRFCLVPTGADDRVFYPVEDSPTEGGPFRISAFRAVYFGTFIPNHGVEHVVEAARLLAETSAIHFELIGDGPERQRAIDLARRYSLSNVTFVDWLGKSALLARAARADVCLGAFGTTPQSLMTVQNKIYEGLAMAKPVVTGDSPAVRAALHHGEHAYLVERANPAALATAILALQADPALRQRLARQGHRLFLDRYTPRQLGRCLHAHLAELVGDR